MSQPVIRGIPSNFYIIEYDGHKFIGHYEDSTAELEMNGVKIIRRMSVPEVLSFLRDAYKEGKIDE